MIFREIVELGYEGKIRILSEYVRSFKPKAKEDPLVRFETEPGHQMQVDFTIIRGGGAKNNPLKAFVATLGYSRASFVYFYDNEKTESWIDGLRRAFEFFGGVPREVLFDNAKSIITQRHGYGRGNHKCNEQLKQFSKDYAFVPTVCLSGRAKTKGKVERYNRYLKSSFVCPLEASLKSEGVILTPQIANAEVGRWLYGVANCRIHGTTKQKPLERLRVEKEALMPLSTHIGNGTQVLQSSTNAVIPLPIGSLQHSLSTFDQLLEIRDTVTR